MSVIGIDPGVTGALAEYNYLTGVLEVVDMPIWFHALHNGKKRARVDAVKLFDYFEMKKLMGAELVLLEEVGGRPGQSAANGFQFGYVAGLIYMGCVAARLPVETVKPSLWKKDMNVPGKKRATSDKAQMDILMGKATAPSNKEIEAKIIARADEFFPHYKDMWRGPKGGFKTDHAEAALLARYCADHRLNSTINMRLDKDNLSEWYRAADFGG